MIRFIITIAFFLVIALLSYNYFFGTVEEKEQAKEIFSKGAEVVDAGADLLKSEYRKYEDGKYKEALDNINNLLSKFKAHGGELLDEINNWEQRKIDWEERKYDLQKLLDSDSDSDSIDDEKIKSAVAALEKERKILESEGKQLEEKAK